MPELMKLSEASRRLGLSRPTMTELIRQGELPAVEIGGRIFIARDQFERMLAGKLAEAEARCHTQAVAAGANRMAA